MAEGLREVLNSVFEFSNLLEQQRTGAITRQLAAWAAILAIPYSLLSGAVPARKMGVYMGIFNFYIVIPQLVAASVLGAVLSGLFGGQSIYAMLLGGVSFVIGGLLALRVK